MHVLANIFYFMILLFHVGFRLYYCFFSVSSIVCSQKVNSSLRDSTSAATTPTKYTAPTIASGPDHPLGKNPRKSWSSIAYNNKNFPDGKLGYEHQQQAVVGATAGQRGSSTAANQNMTSATNANNKLFSKGYSKFERSGQEVMARASQIVQ